MRAKGFNAGLIAVLEKPEDVKVYADHPEHQKYVVNVKILWLVRVTLTNVVGFIN